MMFLKGCSPTAAAKRYQRDVVIQMGLYVGVLVLSMVMVRQHGSGQYSAYFWALLAAMPICGVVFRTARYLSEETDEFQRLMTMQAILFGTAGLLVTLVVSDFLRVFAHTDGLPPFWGFLIFSIGMGATGLVQKIHYRVRDDE